MLSLPTSLTSLSLPPQNPRLVSRRYSSTNRRPSIGSNWDSNAETVRTGRFRLNPKDEFLTDDEDAGDDYGFRSTAKQRVWWSGESSFFEDDEEEFGFWEESSDSAAWIFKILRAFGWMLPAMAISLLLGTGSNAFFMALALPLVQSALSLVTDKLWGVTSGSPKHRPRAKKKPFERTASNVRMDKEKQQENVRNGKEKKSYRSWTAANDGSAKNGVNSAPGYGGWDELDKHRTAKFPKRAPTQKEDSPQRQPKTGKLSRRRNRDTPLLLRLVIAVFPFLGSWTNLL